MRGLVGAWRLSRTLGHLALGIAVVALRFPSRDAGGRQALIRWWSAKLLSTLGIGLTVHGAPRAGATLLVANHVSWLDIAAIHAVAPQARFVSKSDVRRWPLLGGLAAAAGTLFIERESKRDALRVVHMVAVFPEGTTGAGRNLLPFHANLLQAAIATSTPAQPVVLRFHQPGHAFSPASEFLGQTTLLQSLWRLACAKGLQVTVQLLDAEVTAHADRRALAAHLRERIGDALARAG
jgi:1-acyl-sn-glycerol-3-phosphate acyltransferase